MYLEIHAYSNMEHVAKHEPPIEAGKECADLEHDQLTFAHEDAPDGCYRKTDATRERHVRIGPPYEDYAWWVDHLSQFAHQVSFSAVTKDAQAFQGKAFWELLCCLDDYTAFGPKICAKIAETFAAHKDSARRFASEHVTPLLASSDPNKPHSEEARRDAGNKWFNDYEDLEKAFQIGAQDGMVIFDLDTSRACAQAMLSNGDPEMIEVKILAPQTALVIDSGIYSSNVENDDIVRLDKDPGEGIGIPIVEGVVFRPRPEKCEIEFYTEKQRDRMVALAAALNAEVIAVESPRENDPGVLIIAHTGQYNIRAIATAADISDNPEDEELMFDRDMQDDDGPVVAAVAGDGKVPNNKPSP